MLLDRDRAKEAQSRGFITTFLVGSCKLQPTLRLRKYLLQLTG
jgi:hypothetical protein